MCLPQRDYSMNDVHYHNNENGAVYTGIISLRVVFIIEKPGGVALLLRQPPLRAVRLTFDPRLLKKHKCAN